MEIDAALAKHAGEFFGYFFVFQRHDAAEHFDDRHFTIERSKDRGELDSHRACADYDQRLRNCAQFQDFDIRKDPITRLKAGDHASLGAGRQNHVLCFELRSLAVVFHFNCVHAILRRTGELAVTFNGLNFVLAHQEIEPLGVFGDDLRLTVLNGAPIQLG